MKLIFLILLIVMCGYIALKAMGFLGEFVLFSRIEGQVLMNGKPVSGAEIVQDAIHKPEQHNITRTESDGNGNFVFEKRAVKPGIGGAILSVLPGEVVVSQEINIVHEGKTYLAWQSTKRDYDDGTEGYNKYDPASVKKPFKLVCELTGEPIIHDQENFYGICRFVE